jgi:hypothetical protein
MTPTLRPAPVRKSVRVAAPAERAYEIFTAGIGHWWPRTHHIEASDLDTLVIEPREGGRGSNPASMGSNARPARS